jgi:hypothetical protein
MFTDVSEVLAASTIRAMTHRNNPEDSHPQDKRSLAGFGCGWEVSIFKLKAIKMDLREIGQMCVDSVG